MNFEFSQDQLVVRDEVRRLLEQEGSVGKMREQLDNAGGYDRSLWTSLAEHGWLATPFPESMGGAGLSEYETCLIGEEMGRHIAPVPFGSSVAIVGATLVREDERLASEVIPSIANGSMIAAYAEQDGSNPVHYDGETLTGSKVGVVDGGSANGYLVTADGSEGRGLFFVEAGSDVSVSVYDSMDPSRSLAKVTFTGAKAKKVGGAEAVDRLIDHAGTYLAFEQLGVAEAAMDIAKSYALERYAFGRPIATYQAVKHRLVDMYVKIELARSNCYRAAWASATCADELTEAASAARLSSMEAGTFCTKEGIQIHGGMGFTWEFDCHLYYRRNRLLATHVGNSMLWRDRLIDAVAQRRAVAA